MKPDTKMMSYQNPPIMDEDKTVDPVVVTTITPPTTTTSIHYSKWIMVVVVAVMMMLVAAGAVMMQDGSYYHSSGSIETEDSGITTAIEGLVVGTQGKKTAMTTTTPTPTLQTFIAKYPELRNDSPKEQDFQYQAYLLYLTGMTEEELNAYYNININGSQQDGGGGGETRTIRFCCKDSGTSAGCYVSGRGGPGNYYTDPRSCNARANNECKFVGFRIRCCRSSPDSRLGQRRPWVFGRCR